MGILVELSKSIDKMGLNFEETVQRSINSKENIIINGNKLKKSNNKDKICYRILKNRGLILL